MALSSFLSFLPIVADGTLTVVVDNARPHAKPSAAPGPTKVKLCRWDSSLSRRESLVQSPGSPQRSIDPLPAGLAPILETTTSTVNSETHHPLSTGSKAIQDAPKCIESTRDPKEPPRMPRRNHDYFQEANEKENRATSISICTDCQNCCAHTVWPL